MCSARTVEDVRKSMCTFDRTSKSACQQSGQGVP
jgi:hypothetical protein